MLIQHFVYILLLFALLPLAISVGEDCTGDVTICNTAGEFCDIGNVIGAGGDLCQLARVNYYATGDGSIYGTITTADPTITGVGAFSSLNVIGDVTFTGQDAEIQIAPQGAYSSVLINPVGQGTMSNMYVNALTLSATDTVNLSPVDKNVTISPSGTGQLVVNSGVAGSINNMSIGQTTARDGSFLALNASNGLNSTVIGNVTPADATFTKAIGQQRPVTEKELTNKAYVDSTATALAIALGV